MGLDLDDLRTGNVLRRDRWHKDRGFSPWSGADWGNAAAGEMGEACNIVKKLRRQETNIDFGTHANDGDARDLLLDQLGDELADTITYIDLLAEHYGIDLSHAVQSKFNDISIREGFPERMGLR